VNNDTPKEELWEALKEKIDGDRGPKYFAPEFANKGQWHANLYLTYALLIRTHGIPEKEVTDFMEQTGKACKKEERAKHYTRECRRELVAISSHASLVPCPPAAEAHANNSAPTPTDSPEPAAAEPILPSPAPAQSAAQPAQEPVAAQPAPSEGYSLQLVKDRLLKPKNSGYFRPDFESANAWWEDTFAALKFCLPNQQQRSAHLAELSNSSRRIVGTSSARDWLRKGAEKLLTMHNNEFRPEARAQPTFRHDPQAELMNLDDEDIPTEPELPAESVPQFVKLAQGYIGGYAQNRSAPAEAKASKIHALLSIPKNFLRKLKGKANASTRRRWMQTQLSGTKCVEEARPRQSIGESSEEQRSARKASALLERGYPGKAVSTLMQAPSVNLDHEQTIAELNRLHPSNPEAEAAADLSLPAVSIPSQSPVEARKLFAKAAHELSKGAAAGRSGLTEELISYLLDSDDTAADVAAILLDIMNNDVTRCVRRRLTACRLIALGKPAKKAGQPPAVRPIAIGEALTKISATVAIESCMERLFNDDFKGIQFGVGTRGGTDIIVHQVRNGFKKGCITVALDAKNAFNTPLRSCIRDILASSRDKYGHLYALWNLCYAQPSDLHYRSKDGRDVILSQRGTRQGDPLAALLFALVLTPILKEAKRRFPELDIFAYLDDITIQGLSPSRMKECVLFIQKGMEKIGMALNESKCEWLHDSHPCPFPEWDSGKKFIKILGAYIGPDEVVQPILHEEVRKKHTALFERLKLLRSGGALILMRSAVIPRMNYICRVHEPSVTDSACKLFDALTIEGWSSFAQVNPDIVNRALAVLPTRLGGCGFTSTELVAKAAYDASFDFVFAENPLPQSARTSAIMSDLYNSLCRNRDLALHLEDCKQKGSAVFLTRIMAGVPMSRETAGACLRLRLCSCHKMFPDEPECPGCHKVLQRFDANQHLRGCAKIAGLNCAATHAKVKIGINDILRKRGLFSTSREPESMAVRRCGCGKSIPDNATDLDNHKAECPVGLEKLDSAISRRPDLEFYAQAQQVWVVIDVSLVAVISRNSLKEANATLECLLGARNNTKQDLYKLMVESRNAAFLVASATANGTLSNEMRMICSIIRDSSQLYHDSYERICDEVISVVQEASAHALLNAERRLLQLPPKIRPQANNIRVADVEYLPFEQLRLTAHIVRPSTRPSQVPAPPSCKACAAVLPVDTCYGDWCGPCAEMKGLVCSTCGSLCSGTRQCPECDHWICPDCMDEISLFCLRCAPRHSSRPRLISSPRFEDQILPQERPSTLNAGAAPWSPPSLPAESRGSFNADLPSPSLDFPGDAASDQVSPQTELDESGCSLGNATTLSASGSPYQHQEEAGRTSTTFPPAHSLDQHREEPGRTSTGQPVAAAPQSKPSAWSRMVGSVKKIFSFGGPSDSPPEEHPTDTDHESNRLSSCPLPEHRSQELPPTAPTRAEPQVPTAARRLDFDNSPAPPFASACAGAPPLLGDPPDRRSTHLRNPFGESSAPPPTSRSTFVPPTPRPPLAEPGAPPLPRDPPDRRSTHLRDSPAPPPSDHPTYVPPLPRPPLAVPSDPPLLGDHQDRRSTNLRNPFGESAAPPLNGRPVSAPSPIARVSSIAPRAPDPGFTRSSFCSRSVQEGTTLVFDDHSAPRGNSGIPLFPTTPRVPQETSSLVALITAHTGRSPRKPHSANPARTSLNPEVALQDPPLPEFQLLDVTCPTTNFLRDPESIAREPRPSVLSHRPPPMPRRSTSYPSAPRREPSLHCPPPQLQGSAEVESNSPSRPPPEIEDRCPSLSPLSPVPVEGRVSTSAAVSSAPVPPTAQQGDPAHLQNMMLQAFKIVESEEVSSPVRVVPHNLHTLLLERQQQDPEYGTPLVPQRIRHLEVSTSCPPASPGRRGSERVIALDLPNTPQTLYGDTFVLSPDAPRLHPPLDIAFVNGRAEILLQEYASEQLTLLIAHALRLRMFQTRSLPSRDDDTLCPRMRDDWPTVEALKFAGSLHNLPLLHLIVSAPTAISTAINDVLRRAGNEDDGPRQQRFPQMPAPQPATSQVPTNTAVEAPDLLAEHTRLCFDLMLEHTFLLAWARHCGLERGVPDMKELSAQLLNKGGQIALLRSQAIGKPKSGKHQAEPVGRTISRINTNIDNIAEAAVERLSQLYPGSTRQRLLPQADARPPVGRPQPKPETETAEIAGQAVTSSSSDDDGDRPPARKPRAAEPPRPLLSSKLEKENLAPPHQRSKSSSQRTDLESSIAKQTISASRGHSLPPQPQRCSERNAVIYTPSPCSPAKLKSEVEVTEPAAPAKAAPPRGLSSDSENETQTASATHAESSRRKVKRQVGQKTLLRKERKFDVERTESTAEKKMMYRRKCQAHTEDDARLVPATGEGSSQHSVDNATPTDAGKLTTARLDGALDNTAATADGQPLCVSRPRSRNSSVSTHSFVEVGCSIY